MKFWNMGLNPAHDQKGLIYITFVYLVQLDCVPHQGSDGLVQNLGKYMLIIISCVADPFRGKMDPDPT